MLRQIGYILFAHFRPCVLKAYGLLLSNRFEIMENCITYIKSIVENGWWEDACSSSYHPIPPVSAPGHKLQKPSKESGIFQSFGTINFVVFTKRQNQRGGGMVQSHTDTFQTSQLGRINDTVHQR